MRYPMIAYVKDRYVCVKSTDSFNLQMMSDEEFASITDEKNCIDFAYYEDVELVLSGFNLNHKKIHNVPIGFGITIRNDYKAVLYRDYVSSF